MENNAYWEQLQSKYWSDLNDENLVKKISDAQRVVDELEKSPVWPILTKDAEEKGRYIDDNWQDVTDKNALNNMRVKKSAVKMILTLKESYKQDLDRAKEELRKRSSTKTEIIKDYDND